MSDVMFICADCKKNKLLTTVGVRMSVGALPCVVGGCAICGTMGELYAYSEYKE